MPDKASLPADDGRQGVARRRLPAPERRALILHAALRTFAANGYDGAAMDEIAAAAGISKAVVYDHVPSKRELYTQLLEAIRVDLERAVEQALEPDGLFGEARVRAAVTAIFRYVDENQEASRLLLRELQGAHLSQVGRQLEEHVNEELAQPLREDAGLFAGHPARVRQLRILAELLKSSVMGAVGWWYRHPDTPPDDLIERCVGIIWPAIERARTADV
jgi:AcrR family transcriptional regulator